MLLGLLGIMALFYLPLPPSLILPLMAVIGFNLGAMVTGFALARVSNPISVTGAAYAFVNAAVTATGALFQPLIGWLLDLNWSGEMVAGARIYDPEAYLIAFSVLPAFLAVAFAASLLIREERSR